jgi:hypothetical protein
MLPFSISQFHFLFFLAAEIQVIQQHHSALSTKVKILDEELEKIKGSFPEAGKQFKTHISNWTLSAGILYATKVNKLNNGRFHSYVRPDELPRDVWDEIYIQNVKHFFSSFESVVQIGVYHGKEVDDEERSLVARWSDLMLDFFLDLKELEILPNPRSEKYPGEYAGQFVLGYVLGKFHPCDVATTYLNLDLRKSILGDLNHKRIKNIALG